MDTVILLLSALGLICNCFMAYFAFQFVRLTIPSVNFHREKEKKRKLPAWLSVALPFACALAILI